MALPIYNSDTTGEKDFEEFFTDKETLDMKRFKNLAWSKNDALYDEDLLELFEITIQEMKHNKKWRKPR